MTLSGRTAYGVFSSEATTAFAAPDIPTGVISMVIGNFQNMTSVFPNNTPVLVPDAATWRARVAAASSPSGDGYSAVARKYNANLDERVIVVNMPAKAASSYAEATQQTARIAAIQGARTARSVLGITPNQIEFPGNTWIGSGGDGLTVDVTNINTAVAAVIGDDSVSNLADSFRCDAIVEVPPFAATNYNTNAQAYADANRHDRVILVAPPVNAGAESPTGVYGAFTARLVAMAGWGANPNDRPVPGVTSLARMLSWSLDPPTDTADDVAVLTSNRINVIVNDGGVFRVIGNTYNYLAASANSPFIDIPIRRTGDLLRREVVRRARAVLSGNITRGLYSRATTQVNAYLRDLVQSGLISRGTAQIHPDLNTPANVRMGNVAFRVNWQAYSPTKRALVDMALDGTFVP